MEVLLIEDQAGDILLIEQILAKEPVSIRVRVAMDASQATQVFAQRRVKPDLVILDLNLPDASGLSVLKRHRADAPVVVFTSSSNPDDRQSSLESGACDYIQKPTDLDEYRAAVVEMVHKWAKAA